MGSLYMEKIIGKGALYLWGEMFVGVSLEWGAQKHRCVIISVYAKCDTEAKRRLWERLILARRYLREWVWCILFFGDFNVIVERWERRGVNDDFSATHNLDMRLFHSFVREVDLEDQPLVGRRYNWYHSNSISMSRIDCVLISEDWISFWGDITLWVLPRDVSDH